VELLDLLIVLFRATPVVLGVRGDAGKKGAAEYEELEHGISLRIDAAVCRSGRLLGRFEGPLVFH
jgi:hypothetical protein